MVKHISSRNMSGLSLIGHVEHFIINSTSFFIILFQVLKCEVVIDEFLDEGDIFGNDLLTLVICQFLSLLLKGFKFEYDLSNSHVCVWNSLLSRKLSKSRTQTLVFGLK